MHDFNDRISLPSGTILFVEGELASAAYVIERGVVEIYLARDSGEVFLAKRGPGELVGEVSIIDGRPRTASARVLSDCELVVITPEQLSHRISHADPILRMCLSMIIARYREVVGMVDLQSRLEAAVDPSEPPQVIEAALGTLSLERELRRALRDDEFELFFQPIVHFPAQRLAGFEALLRWRHPTRGLVQPDDFMRVAEVSGVIVDITAWCLKKVGATFPQITAAALSNVESVEPLFMSVNVTAHDLLRASFVDSVVAMLETTGIAPGSINLEVSENVLMTDPGKSVAALAAFRRLNLTVAIDDFGTGYSSLGYLSTLPITMIKIDKSFVRSMIELPTSRKIIRMILRLASELNIPVVAEGIERPPEARLLADLGCAFGQGYFFGKALPLAQTISLIRHWQSLHAKSPPGALRAGVAVGR